eukprot:TRINITY_DN5157_c0_g1_i1.p1 TRINITY_DN5157_c0_g1~~TRINITY_DN5157_c0_g1_i1.p1  ORF type:complete len:662 (-),score=97.78 TRINITY_DN5157_c0_g1_i1:20-2005(-)
MADTLADAFNNVSGISSLPHTDTRCGDMYNSNILSSTLVHHQLRSESCYTEDQTSVFRRTSRATTKTTNQETRSRGHNTATTKHQQGQDRETHTSDKDTVSNKSSYMGQVQDSRVHFSGNIWEAGEQLIQDNTTNNTENSTSSSNDTSAPHNVRKKSIRLLGFYSQLGVGASLFLLVGYWWLVSPLTEGYRWLIVPVVNFPILMFLASIYVFHSIYYGGVPPSLPSPNYLPSEEEANQLALFRWFPELRHKIAWVRLLDTSRSPMTHHTIVLNSSEPSLASDVTIYFKREDLNSNLYSGVKPRTLEFLMASSEANHYHRKKAGIVKSDTCTLYAMGAPGSNQSAATFTHASKVKGVIPGMIAAIPQPPNACNCLSFLVTLSSPGDLRVLFDREIPFFGMVKMLYTVLSAQLRNDTYFQYPGGATPLGAMGHMSAGLELAESVEAGECPDPTQLFIAYGSGCSTAGLVVGLALARKLGRGFTRPLEEFSLHSILVHQDYPKWWGKWWIKLLAADTARLLKAIGGPDISEEVAKMVGRVVIHSNYSHPGYGEPSINGDAAIKYFRKASPPFLGLDPTYSAKAAACMIQVLEEIQKKNPGQKVFPVFWSSKTSQHCLDKTKLHTSLTGLKSSYRDWIAEGCFGEPPYWSAPEPIRNLCTNVEKK